MVPARRRVQRRARGRKIISGIAASTRALDRATNPPRLGAPRRSRERVSRGSERHVESFETRGTRLSEAQQAPQQSDTADPVREPLRPSPLARMLIRLSALV